MPISKGRPGFGVQFQYNGGDSANDWITLAEVVDVPGIGLTHLTADVTHMSSDGFVEHIKLGLKDGKAFTLPMNFVADDAEQIEIFNTRLNATAANAYKIVFTSLTTKSVSFNALVTDIDINHAQRAKADIAVQFTPTGAWTWA